MTDNELLIFIISNLKTILTSIGHPMEVQQAYQPTQQGVPTQPTLFIYKVMDHRFGSRGISDILKPDESEFVHTETQVYETTFQISALATQDPDNDAQLTAADLLKYAAYALQSEAYLVACQKADVGIERVTDIRNPYFIDDRDRYEANPSFDFVMTHNQAIVTATPVIEETEFNIYRV